MFLMDEEERREINAETLRKQIKKNNLRPGLLNIKSKSKYYKKQKRREKISFMKKYVLAISIIIGIGVGYLIYPVPLDWSLIFFFCIYLFLPAGVYVIMDAMTEGYFYKADRVYDGHRSYDLGLSGNWKKLYLIILGSMLIFLWSLLFMF